MDHLAGALEAGKRADLVILAQDPLDESVRKLRDIVLAETWPAGVKMHGHSPLSADMAREAAAR